MTKDEALKVEGQLHVVCQCNWCKAHQEQNLSCKSVQARLAAAWGFVKAQPEPWEKFCDSNCVWTDHHPDCKLAQPEQEPVAWVHIQGNYRVPRFWELNDDEIKRGWEQHPLYTAPPQRKPLTRQQCLHLDVHPLMTIEQVVRVVEAAHGIKENT